MLCWILDVIILVRMDYAIWLGFQNNLAQNLWAAWQDDIK